MQTGAVEEVLEALDKSRLAVLGTNFLQGGTEQISELIPG
jgi:hypothetical protein